jgi:transketolase
MHPTLKRIVDITYQEKLSHLSSVFSAWPIIHEIYDQKKDDEVFILSNGHAGLALYCELEARYGIDPVMLLHKHGIHPGKDLENKLYCSTGSLGSGLPIAVGHALANRNRNVYCLISDGECAEGSIWESLAFIKKAKLHNLYVYANINGMSAYDYLDVDDLIIRLTVFLPWIHIRISPPPKFSFASGLLTHYKVLTEKDYEDFCKFNELVS